MKIKSFIDTDRMIEALYDLKENWDGKGSNPFSKTLIENARFMALMLPFPLNAQPTERNSIQLKGDLKNGSYIEFDIHEYKVSATVIPGKDGRKDYNNKITYEFKYEKIHDVMEKMCKIELEFFKNKGDVSNVNLNT